jgi:hypothetical protein
MAQIIQIVGSLLILSAYTAAQRGVLSQLRAHARTFC